MSQQTVNHLAHETSPYLRQHAHNPVDWYPWGPEALARARALDRPIFLSVGYSACHWCHVMEHESFEDEEIGKLLNEHFISIKVDREERPDLDQIYMQAVMLLTRQGGWPMSVFLTPELKPYYGGTYFPPQSMYGRPSFRQVVLAVSEAWQTRRDEIREHAGQIAEHIQGALRLEPPEGDLNVGLIRNTVGLLERTFDSTYGGFGSAPKFPHPMELRLLLRAARRFDDSDALHMARVTLDRMAMGGIYDHLGGGFHRYSTDERWLVPHFEKMLYDNALLTVAYVEAFQATGDPLYREVVEQTLGYIEREMTSPEGPFFSTQDADSEGVEGKFYVWSAEEIEKVLGKERGEPFCDVYSVTPEGNWEEHNILHRTKTYPQSAKLRSVEESELRRQLAEDRQKLYEVRSRRVWPGRDEKVLTAWNALMIDACARAGRVLEQPAYTRLAVRAADFLLTRMRRPDGQLFRTSSAGSEPKLNAYLEDYAYLLEALVSLYEATFEPRWLDSALDLARVLLEQFWDEEGAGFFFTGKDHEALIARTKDPHDSSVPSGNSMAVTGLLRLAKLTGKKELFERSEKTLGLFRGLMAASPLAAGQMLVALDFFLGPVEEFAVIGSADDPDTGRVLGAIFNQFRPNKVVALKAADAAAGPVGLLADKTARGAVTTYICQNFTCREPLIGAEAAERALQAKS